MIFLDDFSLFSRMKMDEIYPYMVDVISGMRRGDTKVQPRIRLQNNLGVLDMMSALSNKYNMAVTKTYFYGSNLEFSVSLFDMNKSKLIMSVVGKEFTRIRTSATTYSFLKFLGKKFRNALIYGYGYQAYGQAISLSELGIKQIDVAGRDYRKAEEFSYIIEKMLGSLSNAVNGNNLKGYDLIVTATSSQNPVIHLDDVSNPLIVSIGSYKNDMSELDYDLICNSSSLIVDSKERCMEESGEVYFSVKNGCLGLDEIQDLSDFLFTGQVLKRSSNGSIIFKSMGMAAEDLATSIAIYKKYIQDNENFQIGNKYNLS